jgi:hypothetical protein
MHRLLVFALAISIGNVPMAFAGESLLKSGARHVQQIAAAEATSTLPAQATALQSSVPSAMPAGTVVTVGQKTAPMFQQDNGGNLSQSGMRKSTKIMIYAGLALGFVASVYAIDHHVLDITPSSLGTRQD